jgi:FixJ family two-component response regulator
MITRRMRHIAAIKSLAGNPTSSTSWPFGSPHQRSAKGQRLRHGLTIVSTEYPVVAVIDDDRGVLDAMTRLLSTHGFDAEVYVSPSKFLEAVTTTRAICLIVRVQLHEGCGVEFVRGLANLGITFPVIFIDGGNDHKEVERGGMETGCVAFFRKPFSAYLLIEALYDLADSYSARYSVV